MEEICDESDDGLRNSLVWSVLNSSTLRLLRSRWYLSAACLFTKSTGAPQDTLTEEMLLNQKVCEVGSPPVPEQNTLVTPALRSLLILKRILTNILLRRLVRILVRIFQESW